MLEDDERVPDLAAGIGAGRASKLCCRGCGAAIARSADADETHVFANPEGVVFEIVTLRAAEGLLLVSSPTIEHTWFPGYAWRSALCARCERHLGWRFDGETAFFGLIRRGLVER